MFGGTLRFTMKKRELKRRFIVVLACLGMLGLSAIVVHHAFAQQPQPEASFDLCRGIADEGPRLKCFENATREHGANSVSHALGPQAGTWRLVRTPNPTGGRGCIVDHADCRYGEIGSWVLQGWRFVVTRAKSRF